MEDASASRSIVPHDEINIRQTSERHYSSGESFFRKGIWGLVFCSLPPQPPFYTFRT